MPVRDSASYASVHMTNYSRRLVRSADSHDQRPPGTEACMCKCYWLFVHCPAYLFAHSAVDRPVPVGKGREGRRLVA